MHRLLISGSHSGCGKTTVTCGLLAALKARGISPAACKCGPDYIDPMFHRAALGIGAYNLDPFFLSADALRRRLRALAADIVIIEGAMGYYDGIAATEQASAFSVSRGTQTPTVLVVSAKGIGHSLAALLTGFAHYRDASGIKGVIFNDANASRYDDLQMLAQQAGLRAYGFLPRQEEYALPARHLGLLTAAEIADLQSRLAALAEQAEQTLDIDGLLQLAATSAPLDAAGAADMADMADTDDAAAFAVDTGRPPRLAVARDAAFCFIYEENLRLWQDLGCEIVFFSPLKDEKLPPRSSGLYLCGGYPELHTQALCANASLRREIRRAIADGLPTIAECGGFMYLHDSIGEAPMCGVIAGRAFATGGLRRFGYISLTAKSDNLLCAAGDMIRAHEFHYWDSDAPGADFLAQKAGRDFSYSCVHATQTLYAGFPHLFFPANPAFARRFVARLRQYQQERIDI